MRKQDIQDVKDLIGKDKLKKAIEILKLKLHEADVKDEIIIQSAKYYELKKLVRKEIINFEQAKISKSKIRVSLIELLNDLEVTLNQKNREFSYKLGKGLLILILFFGILFLGIYSFRDKRKELNNEAIQTHEKKEQKLHKTSAPLSNDGKNVTHGPNSPIIKIDSGTVNLNYGILKEESNKN